MKSRIAMTIVSTLLMMAFSPLVHATSLTPGNSVVPSLLTGAPGTLLATVNTSYNNGLPSPLGLTGLFFQEVYRTAGGTLDFYYQFVNGTPTAFIARETQQSFAGLTTDVFIRTDDVDGVSGALLPGGVPPVSADRTSNGIVVGFDFGSLDATKVGPGQTSNILVIRTDATAFSTGNSALQGASTVNIIDNVPVITSVIPEPASILLLGSGFLALTGFARRRLLHKPE
jgi:PEP-CTERM motif-containing protein